MTLLAATPAWAQTAKAASQPAEQSGEIIVTAQKRSERLQDVPVSISAFNSATLERLNVQGTKDLTAITPGLNFTQSVYSPQPTIRGIGLRGVGSGDESVVPIYIDGVYQPFIAAADLDLNNVQRIEVLKGPQGALLGRNATAGAINIITNTPGAGSSGKFSVSYGRFNQLIAKAYAAVGNDKVGADIALLSNRDDGYITDIVNGQKYGDTHDLSARAKLRFSPSETVKLVFAGAYTDSQASTGEAYRPLDANTLGARVPGSVYGVNPYDAALTFKPYNNLKNASLSGTLTVDFGKIALTSITGYQHSHFYNLTDSDSTTANIAQIAYEQVSDNIYHETYLTSKLEGPLNFVVGAVYYHSSDSTLNFANQSRSVSTAGVLGSISFLTLNGFGHTDSYAGYLQATYKLTSQLSLTAGGRYTSEKRDAYVAVGVATPLTNQATFTKFTPSVTLQYTPSPRLNIYAKYGEAFKSGIFTLTATSAAALTPVQPENVKQFEFGVKARLTPEVQFNISGYYTDYKNLQSPARNAIGQSFVQNAGAAKIYGMEAELTWNPTSELNLFAGLSLLHGEYRDFPNSQVNLPITSGDTAAGAATACTLNPGTLLGGNRTVICDVSGRNIIRTPYVQANGGFDYHVPVGKGEFGIGGKAYYSGYTYWDTLNYFRIPSYVLLGGDIRWRPGNDRLTFSIWGENLLDKVHTLTETISGTAVSQVLAKPRTFGIRMNADF